LIAKFNHEEIGAETWKLEICMDNIIVLPTDNQHNIQHKQRAKPLISFNREELTIILNVYGRKVSKGEWKDYSIDATQQSAIFSVYRTSHERPVYMIHKDPKLAKKQGAYYIASLNGQVLKRGHSLKNTLKYFEKPVKLLS